MPKALIITILAIVIIALGATAVFITQRQESEEVKKEQPVATCPQDMKDRILSIIATWNQTVSDVMTEEGCDDYCVTNGIVELEPKSKVIPCLLDLLTHKDIRVRFFAIRSLNSSVLVPYDEYISPDLLAIGLKDRELTIRLFTAITLLHRFDDERGLKTLEELRNVDKPMLFWAPPELISDVANEFLKRYSEEKEFE